MTNTPSKDQELLTRLKAGDETAIRDVAEAYGSKIYQLAFRYLRNKEDAEEVTQDVLFKVYRKVDAFRGDAQLSSWIYRITFNAAMSRLRTAKYQRAQAEDAQVQPAECGRLEAQRNGGLLTARAPPALRRVVHAHARRGRLRGRRGRGHRQRGGVHPHHDALVRVRTAHEGVLLEPVGVR